MTTLLEGNELRRAVVEAMGWRVVFTAEDWWLLDPDGSENEVYSGDDYTNADEVWGAALAHDESDIPDYTTDLNTIKHAPLDEDVSLEINNPLPYDTNRMWDVSLTTETGERYEASHPEPATAFWNAWLEMRKAARNG